MNLYKFTITSDYGETQIVSIYGESLTQAMSSIILDSGWHIAGFEAIL